tara:strand:+ start:580 stop:723 length:144 start_codon:yes stop_codon:yes gene_type:complete
MCIAAPVGQDALAFVNSPVGKAQHLTGVYGRVVQDGQVTVGDVIRKA